MKLHYTTGCICTSLTVDGVETNELGEQEMKKVILKMIDYIWKPEESMIENLVSYLLQEVGNEMIFKYGEVPIYDEIEVYRYDIDNKNYLTLIEVPTDQFLIVNELVCDYTKITRQNRWNNKDHCNQRHLEVVKQMIEKIDDFATLQDIFCKILEKVGILEESIHCNCCGDWIYSYDLEIG